MKKTIIALTVFAFVFAFAGMSAYAVADGTVKTEQTAPDKDPKCDGTKKAAKAGCGDAAKNDCSTTKTASASKGDCSTKCDKSAKASAGCDSGKKTITAEAAPLNPETR